MSELKDPKIKLFGKTIELPENSEAAAADEADECGSAGSCEPAVGDSSNQDPPCSSDSMLEGSIFSSGDAEEQEPLEILSVPEQDHSNEDIPSDSDASVKTSKAEEDQAETASNNNPNEKSLKKPDKILPCPRCNSMDTKFCYFNNYNVNQPRHFCKNCQRYWTAGGTMRNVPVGAGRRKNKNSSVPQFRHLTVSEVLHQPNGVHQHPNGAVLSFGPDPPHSESIASVFGISENGLRKPEISVSHGIKENGDDVGNKTRLSEPMPVCHPFSYPGFHWPYPWNPVQWGPEVSYPVPFYSTAPPYWGWNVPWVIPQAGPGPGPVLSAVGPTNSPTLGKHSRDDDNVGLKDDMKEEMVRESDPKKFLWVPKTLRVDDPGEAAKSSIWATLGIKNDGVDCVGGGGGGGGGLSKAFRTGMKSDEKARVRETSALLQANPAALSGSLSFNESS